MGEDTWGSMLMKLGHGHEPGVVLGVGLQPTEVPLGTHRTGAEFVQGAGVDRFFHVFQSHPRQEPRKVGPFQSRQEQRRPRETVQDVRGNGLLVFQDLTAGEVTGFVAEFVGPRARADQEDFVQKRVDVGLNPFVQEHEQFLMNRAGPAIRAGTVSVEVIEEDHKGFRMMAEMRLNEVECGGVMGCAQNNPRGGRDREYGHALSLRPMGHQGGFADAGGPDDQGAVQEIEARQSGGECLGGGPGQVEGLENGLLGFPREQCPGGTDHHGGGGL